MFDKEIIDGLELSPAQSRLLTHLLKNHRTRGDAVEIETLATNMDLRIHHLTRSLHGLEEKGLLAQHGTIVWVEKSTLEGKMIPVEERKAVPAKKEAVDKPATSSKRGPKKRIKVPLANVENGPTETVEPVQEKPAAKPTDLKPEPAPTPMVATTEEPVVKKKKPAKAAPKTRTAPVVSVSVPESTVDQYMVSCACGRQYPLSLGVEFDISMLCECGVRIHLER